MSIQCNGIVLHTTGDVLHVSTDTGEHADIQADEFLGTSAGGTVGPAGPPGPQGPPGPPGPAIFNNFTSHRLSDGVYRIVFDNPEIDSLYTVVTEANIWYQQINVPLGAIKPTYFDVNIQYVPSNVGQQGYLTDGSFSFVCIRQGVVFCNGTINQVGERLV